MEMPTIRSYGRYTGDNYGIHCLIVTTGPLTVWFSYRTMVAFQFDGYERVVCKNLWSRTTGKHLNWIDGGEGERVDEDTFKRLYTEQSEFVYRQSQVAQS